jgi:hypothetical protein
MRVICLTLPGFIFCRAGAVSLRDNQVNCEEARLSQPAQDEPKVITTITRGEW